MIEAVMLWNEPNNKSHWDLELDPDWSKFSRMMRLTGDAIAGAAPGLARVLGGISPIDPAFIRNSPGKAFSNGSMSSQCTAFRSTGICGRLTTGRPNYAKSAR